jgi:hypothetical protein
MMEYVDDRKRRSSEGNSRKQETKINIIHNPAAGRDRVPSNIGEFRHSGAKFPCLFTFILVCVRITASRTVDEFN